MIETKYGKLIAPVNVEYHRNGAVKSAMLESESVLDTGYGFLIPNYSRADARKKYKASVSFYDTGNLENIYLEEPRIIQTSAGDMSAEFVTFYPDGAIRRLFPRYGQLSGYWTEEDEYGLTPEVELPLLGQVFRVHPLCIAFYPSGKVKSLTIWRQDRITIPTKYGEVRSNFGFELTERGTLRSVEPAFGTELMTECGKFYPFNSENYSLHAEKNSLVFDDEGELLAAATIKTRLNVTLPDGSRCLKAGFGTDPLTGERRLFPLSLTFDKEHVCAVHMDGSKEIFLKRNVEFLI